MASSKSDLGPKSDTDYSIVQLSQDQLLVEFQENSPQNPPNWTLVRISIWYDYNNCDWLKLQNKKIFNAVVALLVVFNSGISSALPSNAVPAIMQEFNQSGDEQKVLPTAIFLIGYVIGPMVFSPLSETIGRRPVLLWSFTVFVLATLGCALAPNWTALLIFRLICGLMGAAPQTVIGGVYADLFFDIRTRGRAMVMYMSVCRDLSLFWNKGSWSNISKASSLGPILGPIISGCSVKYGWRWTFRIDLILIGTTWLGLLFLSGTWPNLFWFFPWHKLYIMLLTLSSTETFGPVLLKRQAAKLRRESGTNRYVSRAELKSDATFSTTQIITRPITMLLFEPIITSTAVYISLAYSLVFFYFQAYPIIFQGA